MLIWSTTFVLSSDALASISPALLTVIRFAPASVLLVPFALTRPGLLRTLASPTSAVLGLTGVATYYGLQNLGLLTTTAGTAAILQAVIPIATAIFSLIVLRERLNAGTIIGLAFATVGVVIAANVGAHFTIGALLIAIGAVGYAVYTVLLRRLEAPSSLPGSGRVSSAKMTRRRG